jgi:imidazolonepropionase-like amidohydrolase
MPGFDFASGYNWLRRPMMRIPPLLLVATLKVSGPRPAICIAAAFAFAISLSAPANAYMQPAPPPQAAAPAAAPNETLFVNVRVFDGKSQRLSAPTNVLVRGNVIAAIGADAASATATRIDGGGRTLMPGLIDAHWHAMMAVIPLKDGLSAHPGYMNLLAGKAAKDTLMRGFTTVRDVGGPVWGLKRAIDDGITAGPRIWPSGAMISQTSGHGDYRSVNELPRSPSSPLHSTEVMGAARIADGPDEVRRAVREQLMMGASQLKLAAGGGVASDFDPLDVAQYGEEEFRAAVEAAENWGTYVGVHAYTPRAVQAALKAGVKVIDHGQLIDDATAKMIGEKGAWLSLQPFLDDEDAIPFLEGSENRAKQLEMTRGTDTAYALAKKYKLKLAWGTDTLFDARLATRQGAQLAKMVRWFTPAEVLAMATGTNAELLALSGKRAPYKGRLGVVEVGALADLLLVDGDPVANINLLAEPQANLLIVMKDGQIHKNVVRP